MHARLHEQIAITQMHTMLNVLMVSGENDQVSQPFVHIVGWSAGTDTDLHLVYLSDAPGKHCSSQVI